VPELKIDNFRLGQRRDGALREDRLFSMRSLINYDIVYSDGRLRVRKGFSRFNDTALPAVATQIYPFIDLDGNEHILAVVAGNEDSWYKVNASGAHVEVVADYSIAPRPVVQIGNRVFLGSDDDWWWADDTTLGAATTSYLVGIRKPSEGPRVTAAATSGYPASPGAGGMTMRGDSWSKYASEFTVDPTQQVGYVRASLKWELLSGEGAGSVRVVITTDSAGEPGSAVDNATSEWIPIMSIGPSGAYRNVDFIFENKFALTAGTTYWLVFEVDQAYLDNWHIDFYLAIEQVFNQVDALKWDIVTTSWTYEGFKAEFSIGGLEGNKYYDYVITYFNSTYGIESRPSDRERIYTAADQAAVSIAYSDSPFGDVDRIRIYRRLVGDTPDGTPADENYYLVWEAEEGESPFFDTMSDAVLGGQLQTDDHYCYFDIDDSLRPAKLNPNVACLWKGRVWFAEWRGKILYFSKKLEEDGALGLTGDTVYDYFPLENRLELPTASDIIALRALSQDQLAVYLRDESIWVITGANEPLNPPSHIRNLSRDGLRSFGGSAMGLPGVSSETNQTILDDIQSQYLDDSIIAVFGTEIWVLVDADNDGDLETIMILDLERDLPTRQIFDRLWRMYDYGTTLNDIVVRRTASEFRTMLAADAENAYILELGTGTTDNGRAIVAELETHDLPMADAVSVHQVDLKAKYPGTASSYRVTLTDHNGDAKDFSLSPNSSEDVRGHRTGCRFKEPVSMRAKIVQRAVAQNELRSLALKFTARG
jgi:hypothetical protein